MTIVGHRTTATKAKVVLTGPNGAAVVGFGRVDMRLNPARPIVCDC